MYLDQLGSIHQGFDVLTNCAPKSLPGHFISLGNGACSEPQHLVHFRCGHTHVARKAVILGVFAVKQTRDQAPGIRQLHQQQKSRPMHSQIVGPKGGCLYDRGLGYERGNEVKGGVNTLLPTWR